MFIIPFDAATPYIKGVEYANDQNQQDIKFAQDTAARDADLSAKKDAAALNKLRRDSATREGELAEAAQAGKLSDINRRSDAAIDNADATYDVEAGKRQTAATNSILAADKSVLDLNTWNDGGRDLSTFKAANDTAVGQIKELLRAESLGQMNVDLPTLQDMARDRVKIATQVQKNVNATNDYNARVAAKTILDDANKIDAEVTARILAKDSKRATGTATSLQGVANAAVEGLPEVQQAKAATLASNALSAQREAQRNDRTSQVNQDTEEQTRALTDAEPFIKGFNAVLNTPLTIPADPAARPAFYDSTATMLDEKYQVLQTEVEDQLPKGTFTGGQDGIVFQPVDGPPVPLATFLQQYGPILKFTAYPVVTPKGKTPAQVASEIDLNKARAEKARAEAEARKAIAAKAKLGGGLPDVTARIKAIAPLNPL